MATNYVQPGEVISVPAPADVASGVGVLIGTLFGVTLRSALSGAQVDIATEGVFVLPKTSALQIDIGDRVFWTGSAVNKTAAAQVCVGVAVSAAANPSPTVQVKLGARTPAGT